METMKQVIMYVKCRDRNFDYVNSVIEKIKVLQLAEGKMNVTPSSFMYGGLMYDVRVMLSATMNDIAKISDGIGKIKDERDFSAVSEVMHHYARQVTNV